MCDAGDARVKIEPAIRKVWTTATGDTPGGEGGNRTERPGVHDECSAQVIPPG